MTYFNVIKAAQRSARKDSLNGELDFKSPSVYDSETSWGGENNNLYNYKETYKAATILIDSETPGSDWKKGMRVILCTYTNNGKTGWEIYRNNQVTMLILERSIYEKYFVPKKENQ